MDSNIVITQVSSAAILVWVLQRLKSATWFPWLQNEGQVVAKRIISIAAAIGSHTGISWVWAPAAAAAAGSHTLTLTIPALAVIAVTVWHWLSQYILQELIYQACGKTPPKAAAPVQISVDKGAPPGAALPKLT